MSIVPSENTVSLTRDRLGRTLSVTTSATAQTVFGYNATTLLSLTETVRLDADGDGTMDFERVFTRSYDGLLRFSRRIRSH